MPDSKSIAYLTSCYPRASDTFIRDEVDALRRQGVELTTLAIRRPDPEQLLSDTLREEASRTVYLVGEGWGHAVFNAAIQFCRAPVRLLRAASRVFRSHPAGWRNRIRQIAYVVEAACLASELDRRGIRHVHNHIGESSATVAMAAAEISGAGYSLTIHGPGIFFHPRAWALAEKIERSVFTVCITKFCMSQCMAFSKPESWTKLRRVHCGVSDEFLRRESPLPPKSPRFVCVGRLCAEKGHLILLRAVKRLRDQGLPVELHLIGDGECRATIEEYVRQNHLQQQVTLHGWATGTQVREQLEASRALVLPSFAEGLPVVFMESLAMRRPVIATRLAGIPELIQDGVHGWLVPPADVDALCEAMRAAATVSVETIQRMGQAGRLVVEQRHRSRREATKLRLLFEAALGGESLPSPERLEADVKGDVHDHCFSP